MVLTYPQGTIVFQADEAIDRARSKLGDAEYNESNINDESFVNWALIGKEISMRLSLIATTVVGTSAGVAGASAGAMIGLIGGPPGAAIGAVIGGVLGAVSGSISAAFYGRTKEF